MWVLIDNYDSFTHILHHYLLLSGHECAVYRNDEITVSDLEALHPTALIISPGPGRPEHSGITMDVIARFHNNVPILGVCLGHQAIGMFFGSELLHAGAPMHGKIRPVTHNNHPIFKGVPTTFDAMRYHSLVIGPPTDPDLEIIASSPDGAIMAVAHRRYPIAGVQFHPESAGTPVGQQIINNWATWIASRN